MSQLILRSEALRHCALFEESKYKILTIQAQAGQGKTVLATQFDEASDIPFAWTTCTRSTDSPRQLFEKILNSIGTALPNFSQEAIAGALQQQLVDFEFIDIASQRLQDELEQYAEPITLVLDDTHLLEDRHSTKLLLKRLVDIAPDSIKFIFLTRFPLTLNDEPLFPVSSMMSIDKSLLAFSREEIAVLFNDIFQEPTDTKKIKKLHDATEGWISGLKLLHTSGTIRRLVHADTESLGLFFDELLLPSLSPTEYREMILLAFLDELPEAMLKANASPEVMRWIEDLVAKNCFARVSRGEKERVFRLHHIFQEYLLQQAQGRVSEEEHKDFLTSVGDWYMETGQAREGLNCYGKSENWRRIAKAMREQGLPLLGANQHNFLMGLFSNVPDDEIAADGWLSFGLGATQLLLAPGECAAALEHSVNLFRKENDPFGELLATCSLLNFHVLVSGEFGRKAMLVEHAVELFGTLHQSLPAPILANCAQSIALGRTYYQSNFKDARGYLKMAQESMESEDAIVDPWLIITDILMLGLVGEIEKALTVLSTFFSTANTSWISPTTRFSLYVIQINFLLMAGRFHEYKILESELKRDWKPFIDQSYLGSFLTVWDLDVLISEGRYAEVIELSRAHLQSRDSHTAHMLSQFKHYEMIAHAHLGEFDDMDKAMQQALRERAKGGGPYFAHLTYSLSLAALSLAGRQQSVKRIFHKCKGILDGGTNLFHGQLILAYTAAMHLRNNEFEKARPHVANMLEMMEKQLNRHFFGWSPHVMKPVLAFAVKENIHTGYARKLAREQMQLDILDDGTIVQLMTIQIIGCTQLSLGEARIEDDAMSPTWKSVLTMLALAPRHTVAIDKIQMRLWPEEDPSKSRSKFDTMLSRLRGKLAKTFGKAAVQRHLQLKSQQLQFKHCITDCGMIRHYAKEGTEYSAKASPWQAHNAFNSMASYIDPDFEQSPAMPTLPLAIKDTVLNALTTWGTILESAFALEKALNVVGKAITTDPLNDDMQRRHYNLLTALKRPTDATRSLMNYREVLQTHDFTADDIDHIIDNLLSGVQENRAIP